MFSMSTLIESSPHRLSHVYRYSSIPIIRKENVAEHSFYVAFYSYLIAKEMVIRDYDVDVGVVLSRALLHDLDESHTGDFLREVKYGHPHLKRVLDEVSVSMIEGMTEELNIDLKPDWVSAKNDDIEGAIVKIADFLRVASYMYEEYRLGNQHLWDRSPELMEYLVQLLGELRDKDYASGLLVYIEESILWLRPRLPDLTLPTD